MVAQIYISLPSEYDSLMKVIKYGLCEQQTLDNVINTLTISLLLIMLAAHLHPDQHLQPIHVSIVEDTEVTKVEGVDMIVTEELTISEVVAIAIVVG
jgi:hypothetical protein